jgi:hypothetical protein
VPKNPLWILAIQLRQARQRLENLRGLHARRDDHRRIAVRRTRPRRQASRHGRGQARREVVPALLATAPVVQGVARHTVKP